VVLASKHVYDNRIKYFASTSYAPSDAAPTTTTQRLAISMIAVNNNIQDEVFNPWPDFWEEIPGLSH
jgi:hypothetical protein